MLSPDLHELVQTASSALGPALLYLVARNVKATTDALSVANAQSATLVALQEKQKRDLDEAWGRIRALEALNRKAEPNG